MVTPDQDRPNDQPSGRGLFDAPKREVACRFAEASDVIRDTGQRLGADSPVAQAADRVADSLKNAGRYIESAEPRRVVSDTQNFARRHPELFIGGALAAGLILGRFLRSQPPDDSRAQTPRDDSDAPPADPTEVAYGD